MNKFEVYILYWIMLIEGICGILTLGIINFTFSFDYCSYISKKHIKERIYAKLPLL